MHVTANRQPKRKFITNIINSASITFNNYFIILSLLFHVGSYSPEENFDAHNSKGERHKHLPVLEVTKRPLFSHQWYSIRCRFARFIHFFFCLQNNLSKTICTTKAKLGFIYSLFIIVTIEVINLWSNLARHLILSIILFTWVRVFPSSFAINVPLLVHFSMHNIGNEAFYQRRGNKSTSRRNSTYKNGKSQAKE